MRYIIYNFERLNNYNKNYQITNFYNELNLDNNN